MCLLKLLKNSQHNTYNMCDKFNRCISPAYHHDKCERYVQMRLYSMNKAEITFVYVMFIVLLFLAIIIGISGPPIENTAFYNFTDTVTFFKSKVADLENGGPFIFSTPFLTRYNKQLWLFATVYTENLDDEIYSENIQLSIAITQPRVLEKFLNNNKHDDDKLKSKNYSSLSVNYDDKVFRTRSRFIQCIKRSCDPLPVAHLGYIKFVRYKIIVKFHNLGNFHKKYNLVQITFTFRSYSSEYTQMELSFRAVYMVTTAFAVLWFGNALIKYPIYDWTYEQKWLMMLLLLLFLYDGPLYSGNVIFDHWIVGLIDSVFQITFLSCLALFNICIYHALRQNERRLVSFYMEKIAIIFLIWILSMTISYYHTVWEFLDFSFNMKSDWKAYQVVTKWWLIFAVLYFVYLLASLLKTCRDLRTMPYYDKRLKFATSNIVIMGLIWYYSLNSNYGIIGYMEDSYVAYAKEKELHSTSVSFMAVYTSLNFYIYLMAYMYFPSQKSVFGNVVLKDNPALSMMNNSEDEDSMTRTSTPLSRNSTKLFLNTSDEDNNLNKGSSNMSNNINIKSQNDDSD